MSTLYRDYRPQTFKEVLGQNHIKITLQNEIGANKLAQAFLFCGPRAVGKTTLARVLAKTVNCLNRKEGDYEPCNNCNNCLGITQGKNLDVVEIDAASNTGVDNVRDNIISFSRLSPTNSKFKVFIIDEVHMLSISAFNALLKIIEEPPKHVIFVLCTTEIQKVPLTIISRCERFDFKRISVADIVKKLSNIAAAEKITIDTEVLEAIARRSGGHLRDAESLLGQVFALGDKKISLEQAELVIPQYNSNVALELLEYLSRKDVGKAITLVNSLIDTGVNLKNFTGELIALLRKIMLTKVSPALTDNLGLNLGESLEIKVSAISSLLSWDKIIIYIKRFLEAYNDQKNSAILQLGLELAIIDLCYETTVTINSPKTINNELNSAASSFNPPVNQNKSLNANSIKKDITQNNISENKIISPVNTLSPEELAREINLDNQAVLEKWPEFLIKIKKYNHSLSFVLQNCHPENIVKNKLGLTFKYKFHQDRINEATIKKIIEDTLIEVFGAKLDFCAQLDENMEIEKVVKTENKEEQTSETPLAAVSPVDSLSAEKKPALASQGEPKVNQASIVGDLLKTFGGEVVS